MEKNMDGNYYSIIRNYVDATRNYYSILSGIM